MSDSRTGKLMECPVCFKLFQPGVIEYHVDRCIEGLPYPNNVEELQGNYDAQSEDSQPKRKRRDLDAWRIGSTNAKEDSPVSVILVSESPKYEKKSGLTVGASSITPKSFSSGSKNASPWSFFSPKSNSNVNSDNAASSTNQKPSPKNPNAPLAEQMRPLHLNDFIGQSHILGGKSMLRTLIASNNIPSMILWGPPGCGKTSLATVIAKHSRQANETKFVILSATNAGVNDVKEVVKIAKNDLVLLKRKTILFIDEIHRFNKLQQDTFLPYVENGTITLIGATTENPSFSLNSALLSRCRVFILEKLSVDDIEQVLQRAIEHLEIQIVNSKHAIQNGNSSQSSQLYAEKETISLLANLSDGDARIALNCLHLAVQAKKATVCSLQDADTNQQALISVEDIKESLQRTHLLYDRKGDEHYNCISALHKSMRGSDADAALYWLGRMLEGGEDPLYVARRLVRFASEDVGMSDPLALNQAVSAYQACQFIGMPECDVILAQCVVYLSEAPKSVRVYTAYQKVKRCISSHNGPLPGVPLHLRNAPTKLMKEMGCGKGYKYNPNYSEPVHQEYFPECLKGTKFLDSD